MHRGLADTIDSFHQAAEQSTRPDDRKLAEDYLAALAPLLASAVLGRDILSKLPEIERLFGQTGLIDAAPFADAFSKWRDFRSEYERFALSSMSVNERLFALGIADLYDRAVATRDVSEIERLLQQALIDGHSIRRIVEQLRTASGATPIG